MRPRRLRPGSELQRSRHNRQIHIGLDHVNVIRFEPCTVRCFRYRHRRRPPQDIGQQALVGGIEMLHEYDGEAGIGRQIGQQTPEYLEPTRGCPNPHYCDSCPGTRRHSPIEHRLVQHLSPREN